MTKTDQNPASIPPAAFVFFGVLLWSTGGLFIKLTSLDAYQVTFFRSFLAAATVAVLTRKSGFRINGFGLLCSVFYATLLFLFVWATKMTTAANAIFLQYTAPVYILILSPFVIGEKFHLRDLLTILVCLGGMGLFFVGKLEISDYQGNFAALASGLFYGLYVMLLKHPRGRELNPNIAVIYGNLLLAVITLPAGVSAVPIMGGFDLLCVSFLGIVQIGVAYILFIKGVTLGTRPLDASIIGFIEPLLNPVWVFFFYGERPSNWAVLGGVIIIGAVLIHTLRQLRAFPRQIA
jgi:drug/metabolite transporter (DMT)-like permease